MQGRLHRGSMAVGILHGWRSGGMGVESLVECLECLGSVGINARGSVR